MVDLIVVLEQEQHDANADRGNGIRQGKQDFGVMAVGLVEENESDDVGCLVATARAMTLGR